MAAFTALPLKGAREGPSPLPAVWYSPSFSQMTSTGFVEAEEMDPWEETPSRENTDDEEEDAEEEMDDA